MDNGVKCRKNRGFRKTERGESGSFRNSFGICRNIGLPYRPQYEAFEKKDQGFTGTASARPATFSVTESMTFGFLVTNIKTQALAGELHFFSNQNHLDNIKNVL
jgi:hypothetical protein